MTDKTMPRGAMPLRLPRGAIPSPRSALARAMPYTSTEKTPVNYVKIPARLSFWGNNTYGDCVTAEEAFAKACHEPELFISDQVVIDWAKKHNVLNGAYLNSVLEAMQTDGFQQDGHSYCDGPFHAVDWTNVALLQNAISNGPVKIGIAADQLEAVYTYGASGWFALDFHQDNKEDHCVTLCGFGTIAWLAHQLHVKVPPGVDGAKPGFGMFTWDTIGIIDAPSMLAITHEAWIRSPTTVVK